MDFDIISGFIQRKVSDSLGDERYNFLVSLVLSGTHKIDKIR